MGTARRRKNKKNIKKKGNQKKKKKNDGDTERENRETHREHFSFYFWWNRPSIHPSCAEEKGAFQVTSSRKRESEITKKNQRK